MKLSSDFKEKLSTGVFACWRSPANVSLIKYWGKKGFQLPSNASISFALHEAYTITRVDAKLLENNEGPKVSFTFEGEKNPSFALKIESFMNNLKPYLSYLPYVSLTVQSGNNFPHSAGIASSASAMSALALVLCSIEKQLSDEQPDEAAFYRKASFISRLGSGSACRSIYGGYSVWGKHDDFDGSSDEYAIPIGFQPHPLFENLRDTILVVDQTPKKVSSRSGHGLMNGHPYAKARMAQATANLSKMNACLHESDWNRFAEITENEALSLHGMMLCASPGYLLMHPNTLNVLNTLAGLRKQDHVNVCFTLDAGPNVHLLYPDAETDKVIPIIEELQQYCFEGKIIHDKMGRGPEIKHCK